MEKLIEANLETEAGHARRGEAGKLVRNRGNYGRILYWWTDKEACKNLGDY